MIRLAAFPKCWIEEIVDGRMSLESWIDTSTQLECDGLELYALFLRSHEEPYLRAIRRRIESQGMSAPIMCFSPDFYSMYPLSCPPHFYPLMAVYTSRLRPKVKGRLAGGRG